MFGGCPFDGRGGCGGPDQGPPANSPWRRLSRGGAVVEAGGGGREEHYIIKS